MIARPVEFTTFDYWSFVERCLVVITLLLAIAGLQLFIAGTDDPDAVQQGSLFAQAVWGLVYLGSLLRLWHLRTIAWRRVKQSWWLLLLPSFLALSFLWSDDPFLTLRRAVGLTGTTAFAYYLACRFSLDECLDLLSYVATLVVGCSILLALALPQIGVMHGGEYAGAWRGVFGEKNGFGLFLAFSISVYLANSIRGTVRQRTFAKVMVVACFATLLFTRSATALLTALCELAAMLIILAYRRNLKTGLSLTLLYYVGCAGLVGIFVLGMTESGIAGLLGRSADLTGRLRIWPMVQQAVQERPWLGYGYGVFWTPDRSLVQFIFATQGWIPAHAHDGFLELMLDGGCVAVLLFLFGMTYGMRGVLKNLNSGTSGGEWTAVIVVAFCVANITESMIAKYNTMYWVLFTTAMLNSSTRAKAKDRE